MKHGIFIIAIVSILAACNPSTPQLTATPIPSYTPSPIPTQPPTTTTAPTEALASAERDSTMDRPLEIISSFPIENVKTKEGAVVNGAFSVDRSAERNGLHEVSMPDSLGAELLLKVGATLDKYHGETPTTGELTDNDITDYARRLAAAQNGQGPIPTADIFAFDANKSGNKMEPIKVALFPGNGEVPQGVQRIDNVEFVYLSGYVWDEENKKYINMPKMPRFTIVHEAGIGYETEIVGSTLRIKVGLSFQDTEKIIHMNVPKLTELSYRWIEKNTGQSPLSLSLNGNTYLNKGKALERRGFKAK